MTKTFVPCPKGAWKALQVVSYLIVWHHCSLAIFKSSSASYAFELQVVDL
jgi:hypothetical protein